MNMDSNIKINVETEGIEETTAKLETLADAFDGFPAQVVIKGCRDCTFNIYPSQTKIVDFKEEDDCPNCGSDNRGDNDDT